MPAYQYLLARMLHKELSRLLDAFPKEIRIESGLLLDKDWQMMNMESKIVPVTDDAMFGRPVRTETQEQIDTYGEWFSMSVGAARLAADDPEALFEAVVREGRARRCRFGRIGFVSGGGYRDSAVVLVTNDKSVALSPEVSIRYFPPVPYVWRSSNGGATVRRV
jgi:hypothetical protein